MKIPIIRADEPLSQIPVTATTKGAGRTWDAVGRLGEQITDISTDILNRQTNIRMATEAAQAEIDMEAANEDIVNRLRKTSSPDTYYQEWGKEFQQAMTKRLEGVRGVRTRASVELALGRMASRELIQQKSYANKLWVDTEKAKLGEILQNYAENDKLEQGEKLIDLSKDIYSPTELLTLKTNFKKLVEAKTHEGDMAAAMESIRINPPKAYLDLHDPNYLPHLTPTDREQYKNSALSASKILEGEQERKTKEAKILAHDKEYQEIGTLAMQHKYKDAYVMAESPTSLLTGPEKFHVKSSIEAALTKKAVVDPVRQSLEIIKVNNMIATAKSEDVAAIRNYIALSPSLAGANPEQYINKLEAKLTEDIKDGRNRGYRAIVQVIFPRAFDLLSLDPNTMTEADIGRILNSNKISPEQVVAIEKTQMALDSWIDLQMKGNKYPSSSEIRRKALALAGSYQMSIGEKIDFWRKQEAQEEMAVSH